MSKLSACFVVGMLALAACGDDPATPADAAIDAKSIDAKVFMDAPPPVFDWSCESNTTPPSTAPAQITLGGTVQGVSVSGLTPSVAPVSGAKVTACKGGAANCMTANQDGNATSNSSGAWEIAGINTGSSALNDYLEMDYSSQGWRTVYTYPAAPFSGNQGNIPMLTFNSSAEGALSSVFSCNTAQAIVGLAVVDRAGAPVTDSANVMIAIKQGGNAVTGTTTLDAGLFNSMAAGTFLVCGVPANATTEVSATYMGHQLLAHNVKTVAGDTTATILVPGY